MFREFRSRLGLVLLAGIVFAAGGCKDKGGSGGTADSSGSGGGNAVSGNKIIVGEYASLTGDTATFGTATHNGIMLAIDEANSKGGINGKQIELRTEDDRSKAEDAQTVVTKLCTQDKVIAVLGEVASTRSMRGGSVCQQYKVPMISPSSTNPEVTKDKDYVFRVCFTDDFQAAVMAHFAHDQGYKKVAIFRDTKSDYSQGFSDLFSKEYTKLGGTIAGDKSYSAGDTDFKAQLTALKETAPEAVLVPGYYTDVSTIARQAKEVGLSVPLLGGDGWDSPKLIPGAGTALEGSYFSDHYFSRESTDPNIQNFLKAWATYKEKHSDAGEPDALAALGYDAAHLLIEAMQRAKTLDTAGIRDAIASTKDFQGVTGKITMDANRNARKNALVFQIQGNSFKPDKTYSPEQVGQ